MRDFIHFVRAQGVVGFAVGFILGRALSDMIGSFVTDILNPIIGLLTGSLTDLSRDSWHIAAASINYGNFIVIAINFFLLCSVVYVGAKILHFEKLDRPKQ